LNSNKLPTEQLNALFGFYKATRKPGGMSEGGGPGGGGGGYSSRPTVDELMAQTSTDNTSVYVGGVPPGATEDDIRQTFKKFGDILDIRHFKPQGYAFVKYVNKLGAAKAIHAMNGNEFMGQSLRLNWGKVDGGGVKADPSGYGSSSVAGMFNNSSGGPSPAASQTASAQMQQYWQYYQQYYQQNPQWSGYLQQGGSGNGPPKQQ